VLIGLGVAGYALSESKSITALIPAFVGLPLAGLGALALKDNLRKHAMHAAVLLGLLGCLAAGGRAIPGVIKLASSAVTSEDASEEETSSQTQSKDSEAQAKHKLVTAVTSQGLMALVCGIFVVLCVLSFIQARRNRGQQAGQ